MTILVFGVFFEESFFFSTDFPAYTCMKDVRLFGSGNMLCCVYYIQKPKHLNLDQQKIR